MATQVDDATLHTAFLKADAAGDTASAQALADEIAKRQSSASDAYAPDKDGYVTLPDGTRSLRVDINGTTPTPPPEQTPGRSLGLGVGDVAQGFGDVLGIVGNPLNYTINKLAGTNLSTDLGQTVRDALGTPEPVTEAEKLASAVNRGGAGALATFGVGAAIPALEGGAGAIVHELASSPVRNFIMGLTGGAGAEAGDKVGGTPGALIGGVLGGAGGMSMTRLAERAAEHFPRSVMVDEAGKLTEDGREIAQRIGADPEAVQETYTRLRRPTGHRQQNIDREAVRAGITPEQRAAAGQIAPTAEAPIRPPNGAPLDQRSQAILDAVNQTVSGTPGGNGQQPPTFDNPFDEAASERIRLTRGQAEQNFDVQNDENSLRVSATNEGEQARQFFQQQQRDIAGAVDRFRSTFGPDAGTAADRGQILKDSVTQLRDSGAEGVRALYREAEALGGDALHLDTDPIREAATDVLIDEAVPESTKKAISQELARYGIIGTAEPTNEAGITRVALDDGSSVSFRGPPKTLTASNAEDLRRAINRLYDPMRPNLSGQSIKPAIDDALETALNGAAEGEGGIADAYGAARAAHREQRQTYKAKDIIESIIANKKGTDTPVLLPEKAIAQTIGAGADGVSNLRKTKALLLGSNTPHGRQAWGAIQHQALADIFDSAWSRNVNHGNGQIGDIVSGAKLNSAIDKFGVDKLRTVLDPEDFNGLMKLRRIIGNATIPITGTTNPSGTATKIINYMKAGTLRFAGIGTAIASHGNPLLSVGAHGVGGLLAKGKEIAATRKTLAGITSYDGRVETGQRLDQQARDFARDYIRSGKAGKLLPASINLSATQGAGDRK